MVEEPRVRLELAPSDVEQYLAADALFKAVGDQDPMQYWKSAPYLPHFMQGYKVNERLTETLARSPEKITKRLEGHADAFLKAAALERWSALDPAHAKLRELVHELLDTGLWKLLWLPPTVPYWPLAGAFDGQDGRTKSLLFSAWNVVPDVVSAVISYEAERRMVGGQMASYLDPDQQQRPLLRLTRAADASLSRHRLLLLLLPCLTLADAAHPLAAPAGTDRRVYVRGQVDKLLADPRLPNVQDGPVDERWEWAIPLLLDPAMRAFLETWRDADPEQMDKPNPEVLPSSIDEYLALDPARLGRRPDGLADLVTDVALGAPGVLAARMLQPAGLDPDTRRAQPRSSPTRSGSFSTGRRSSSCCFSSTGAEDPAATTARTGARCCATAPTAISRPCSTRLGISRGSSMSGRTRIPSKRSARDASRTWRMRWNRARRACMRGCIMRTDQASSRPMRYGCARCSRCALGTSAPTKRR